MATNIRRPSEINKWHERAVCLVKQSAGWGECVSWLHWCAKKKRSVDSVSIKCQVTMVTRGCSTLCRGWWRQRTVHQEHHHGIYYNSLKINTWNKKMWRLKSATTMLNKPDVPSDCVHTSTAHGSGLRSRATTGHVDAPSYYVTALWIKSGSNYQSPDEIRIDYMGDI